MVNLYNSDQNDFGGIYHIQNKIQFTNFLWGHGISSDPMYRGVLLINFKIFIIHDMIQSSFLFLSGEINGCDYHRSLVLE